MECSFSVKPIPFTKKRPSVKLTKEIAVEYIQKMSDWAEVDGYEVSEVHYYYEVRLHLFLWFTECITKGMYTGNETTEIAEILAKMEY